MLKLKQTDSNTRISNMTNITTNLVNIFLIKRKELIKKKKKNIRKGNKKTLEFL